MQKPAKAKLWKFKDVFYSPNTRICKCVWVFVFDTNAFCIECLMSLLPVIWQSCHIDTSLLFCLLFL